MGYKEVQIRRLEKIFDIEDTSSQPTNEDDQQSK
jgi:hypothetical protein